MTGRAAADRLDRCLYLLAAASREGGGSIREIAEAFGVREAEIVRDLEHLTEREFYHPGGWVDGLQITVEADRLRMFTREENRWRPVRLTPVETLCLALGLRGAGASVRLDPEARAALLARAEEHLAACVGEDPSHLDGRFATDTALDAGAILGELLASAREGRACAILYATPGREPSARVIHPYTLAYAEGRWYAVGWCAVSEGVRVFRLDRVLEACRTDEAFRVPEDFRVEDYLDGGRVFRAEESDRVRIRYGPRIARWIRERAAFRGWELEDAPDGGVTLEHEVADPRWVVQHVLTYGADAEVLEPESYRALVRDAVAELLGAMDDDP